MKKRIKKLITSLTLGAAPILSLTAISGIVQQSVSWTDENKAYSDDTQTQLNLSDWMADVDGDKLLSELSIPGTHDSGMYDGRGVKWFFGSAWARTQYKNLPTQLKMGIRYFDIRLDRNNLVNHGGAYSNNLYLQNVLDECKKFLTAHSSETIILRIKDENVDVGNLSATDCIKWRNSIIDNLYKFKDFLFKNDSRNNNLNPTLNELRGKVFVVNNFHHKVYSDNNYGIFIDHGNNWNIWQDTYDSTEDVKMRTFESMANMYQDLNDFHNDIMTNFLSRSNGEQPWWTSKALNKWLVKKLQQKEDQWEHLGIVPMDFPGDALALAIVRKNYMYSQRVIKRGILGRQLNAIPVTKLVDNTSIIELNQPMKDYFVEVYKGNNLLEKKKITDTNTRIQLANKFVLGDSIKLVFYKETPTNIYYPTPKRILNVEGTLTVSRNQEYVNKLLSIGRSYVAYSDTLANTTYQNFIRFHIQNEIVSVANSYIIQPMTDQRGEWADLFDSDKTEVQKKITNLKNAYEALKTDINTFKSSVPFRNSQLSFITTADKSKLSEDSYQAFQDVITTIPKLPEYQNVLNIYIKKKNKLAGLKTILNDLQDYLGLFNQKVTDLDLDNLQINYQDKKAELNQNIQSIQVIIKETINNDATIDFANVKSRLQTHYDKCSKIIKSLEDLKKQYHQNLYRERLRAALQKCEEQKTQINYLLDNSGWATKIDQLITEINEQLTLSEIQEIKINDIEQRMQSAISMLNGQSNLDSIRQSILSSKYLEQSVIDQKFAELNQKRSYADATALQNAVEQLNNFEHQAINQTIDSLSNLTDTQESSAKTSIEQCANRVAVNSIVSNVIKLNNFNAQLKNFDSVKSSINYIEASTDLKKAYDNAEIVANTVKNSNTFDREIENIDTAIPNLQIAKNNLDGQRRLDTAKADADKNIDKLTYLSDNVQKPAAKTSISNAQTVNDVNLIVSNATKLNAALEQLSIADSKLNQPAYTEAAKNKKQTFDSAKSAIDNIKSNSDFTRTISNIDRLTVNLKNAIKDLDGDSELSSARTTALNELNKLTNLTGEPIKVAQDAINAANTINLVNLKLLEAQKQNAINKINSLSNLGQTKKEKAAELINNKTTKTEIDAIQWNYSKVDSALPKIKEAEYEKSKINYTEAEGSRKTNFDTILDSLLPLKSQTDFSTLPANFDANVIALKNSKGDLNGLDRLKKEKEQANIFISNLSELSNEQKDTFANSITSANSISEVADIKNNAEKLNNALIELKAARQTAKSELTKLTHLLEEQIREANSQIDAATTVQRAKNIVTNATNVDVAIEQVQRFNDVKLKPQFTEASTTPADKKQASQTAFDNLSGVESIMDFRTNLIDQITNKSEELKNAINSLDGQQNLDAAIAAAKSAIDALPNLSDDEKRDAKTEVEKQTTIANVADKLLNAKKQDASNKIDSLSNLSDDVQKPAVKALINSKATKDEIDAIVANVEKVNSGIGTLNDEIVIKEEIQYKQASDDVKENFYNAITALDRLSSYTDFETPFDQLDIKLQAVSEAKSSLNGKDRLDAAKGEVIKAIEGLENLSSVQKDAAKNEVEAKTSIADVEEKLLETQKEDAIAKINSLPKLSETQKEKAIKLVEAESDKAGIDKVVSNASSIDGAIAKVESTRGIESEIKYTQASNQDVFDDAVTALNNLTTTLDFDELYPNLDNKLDTLKLTHDALNGADRLKTAKEEALTAIEAASNLSDTQKEVAKKAVNSLNQVSKIKGIKNNVKEVNSAFDVIENAEAMKETTQYIQADKQFKDAFDNALVAFEEIKAKEDFTTEIPNLSEKLVVLQKATEALNGKVKPETKPEESAKEEDKKENTSSGSNLVGPIAGGVSGLLALIGSISGFVFYKKRRKRK
ncbi:phosphatidylinositol-specific phospholipase C domain-containing protein [Mycoplasma sp. 2704]|uniref:phosphatidylinositol-specific phospholipase C domain-containing protein n=1 Tax=Mycoplasma sp. 2704 TaxID=3108529 RepID=UPI002B1D4CCB|nr:phosphatidylinositol-specific phospholipase C domain-containing protein [Mycoplasma sp. 2704]MEA4134235.1 phosphatidylinositol-specific phospholipase C domain-containing protein [Mycoplasma sp. 2704]